MGIEHNTNLINKICVFEINISLHQHINTSNNQQTSLLFCLIVVFAQFPGTLLSGLHSLPPISQPLAPARAHGIACCVYAQNGTCYNFNNYMYILNEHIHIYIYNTRTIRTYTFTHDKLAITI
jgi:hypothetical protein